MFKNRKFTAIAVALLLAICLTGGTVAAYAASTANKGNGYVNEQEDAALTAQKQDKKDEIALDANGNSAAPGGRGSRLQAKESPEIAADLGIDTVGMSNEEIARAVKHGTHTETEESANYEEQKEYAAILGIDTAGMTTGDEIRNAIRAYKEVKVNENSNDPKAVGNGEIDEQEDAALTAQKQSKKSEIALDENGNPAVPGGRGSKIR